MKLIEFLNLDIQTFYKRNEINLNIIYLKVMEVNEEEINRILGAMFTNSIDIGKFKIDIGKFKRELVKE